MTSPETPIAAIILDATKHMGNDGTAPINEVAAVLLDVAARPIGLGDFETAVNHLVDQGMLSVVADGFVLTAKGNELLAGLVRHRDDTRRRRRIQEALAVAPLGASRSSWRFDAGSWAQVARSHTNLKRSRLEDRKAIVDALIVAVDRIDEINTAVRACDDRRAAVEVLTQASFGFNEMQSTRARIAGGSPDQAVPG
ncbi:MAG: hypothetical protein M3N98_08375 [Actinomycetota bacterium]|nr:hypothetical protein [Actinomycetota bacterium]